MKTSPYSTAHHSFMYLWLIGALLVLGGLGYSYLQSHPDGVMDGQHEGDVRTTVAQFGNQLNAVSLLSPTAAEDIRKAYEPYVSPELLAAWIADPSTAPGRSTSSPWPDHIEVDSVTMTEAGTYDVLGRIMLKTSTGDAGIIPVSLTVTNGESGYVITAYEEINTMPVVEESSATVTAALGETVYALGESITPLEVLEDSRCPSDVVCIQAGQARVNVRLVGGMGTSTMPFTAGSEEPITTEVNSIWLTVVEPYPLASDPTEDAKYRFTFRVEKR